MGKKKQKKQALEVTDHAVVRYIQRVKKVDVNSIKREILKGIVVPHKTLGNGDYPIENKRAIVRNGKVVTIK